jgi:two-component system, NtrC family, response regulator
VAHAFGWGQIIGQSLALQQALGIARKVAASETTVLLSGETGTGKELFARAIHGGSPRAVQPFFALNCSSLSKDLLESELFGHVAGAFTGALRDKRGLIEEAQGGTLFLDEIGEMPLALQAKLLRVLEARQFFKVGSVQPTEADVRVISATNRHLPTEVDEGRFREDLYYRLNVVTLDIPPLRERKKDIAVLASHFVQLFAMKMGKRRPALSREFIQLLERQVWKGNIRELRNVIERALILSDGPQLRVESLPVEFRSDAKEVVMLSAFDLESVEKLHIQRVLNYTKGNKVEAAKLLNIGLTTVYRKFEEYGLG